MSYLIHLLLLFSLICSMEKDVLYKYENLNSSKEKIKKIIEKFLPTEELELIHFKNKDIMYQSGNPSEGMYFIVSGKVKLSTKGCDNKEHITKIVTKGDYLGYESLLNKSKHAVSAVALTDVTAAVVPENIFLYLLESNPEFSKVVAEILSLDMAIKDLKFVDILYKPIRGRLADALLLLEQKFERDGDDRIMLSRVDLASYVGSVRETISRLISEFKKEKLIETTADFIKIINREKLISISNLYK